MNQDIAKCQPIDKNNLDPNQYLVSLLNEAYHTGQISQQDYNDLQVQIMEVLRENIIKYTCGYSSSVKTETAENLLASALYCLDTYCLSFNDAADVLYELKTNGIKKAYQKGLELVRSSIQETRQIYNEIKSNFLDTRLVAYNSSLYEGIPGFFAQYDVLSNAHETMADIDYPLAWCDINATGIRYIKLYLQRLNFENLFCSLFIKEDIDQLLENYGRTYRIDYPEFLLNIFEIVLSNSIFSVMAGNGAATLSISENQFHNLSQQLKRLSVQEIYLFVHESFDVLLSELGINDPELQYYVHRYKQELIPRLIYALEQNSLDKLIIHEKNITVENSIIFVEGQNMDDQDLRLLIDQLLECTSPSKKVDLILSNVGSLTDILDILESDCLSDEEYVKLFESIGN